MRAIYIVTVKANVSKGLLLLGVSSNFNFWMVPRSISRRNDSRNFNKKLRPQNLLKSFVGVTGVKREG